MKKLVGGISGLRQRGIRWSRQHIRRLEKKGQFPARIRTGENSIDWIESEIDAWIDERAAERDGGKAA